MIGSSYRRGPRGYGDNTQADINGVTTIAGDAMNVLDNIFGNGKVAGAQAQAQAAVAIAAAQQAQADKMMLIGGAGIFGIAALFILTRR